MKGLAGLSALKEPELTAPIAPGYKSTWGDKKRLCEHEAYSAYEAGLSLEDNPYINASWPHAWWEHFFNQCVAG